MTDAASYCEQWYCTICRTARRHTPEAANFSKIPTAHNSMRLYMCRDCSGGRATTYGLHDSGIESRWGLDFPHSSTLKLGPIQHSGNWEQNLSPEGKLFGKWHWPPKTCSVGVKERVDIYIPAPHLGLPVYFISNASSSFRRSVRRVPTANEWVEEQYGK